MATGRDFAVTILRSNPKPPRRRNVRGRDTERSLFRCRRSIGALALVHDEEAARE
jgi:hypothetical protein